MTRNSVLLFLFFCAGEVSWDMYMSSLTCQDDMFNYPFPTTCSLEAPSFDDDDAEADDVDRHILNPPPSVSTTAFPSSVAQMMANGSSLAYCAIANAPSARPTTAPTRFPTASTESTVSFTAAQVRPTKFSHSAGDAVTVAGSPLKCD